MTVTSCEVQAAEQLRLAGRQLRNRVFLDKIYKHFSKRYMLLREMLKVEIR